MPQGRVLRRPRPPPPGLRGPPGMGHMRAPRGPPPMHMGPPRGPPPVMPPMPPMPAPIPLVSSCTNANDPMSMDSRLFVGNLNTLALSKEDLEGIFGIYGMIFGISMHKGYAFIQFSHPDEARRAGASEDGKIYAGQAVDINIVSQPKNRNVLKRSAVPRSVSEAIIPKKARPEPPVTNISLQRTLVTLIESTEPVPKVAASLTKTSPANPTPTKTNPAKLTPTKPTPAKQTPTQQTPTQQTPTKSTPAAVTSSSTPATTPAPKPAIKVEVIEPVSAASKPAVVKTNWPDVLICGVCKLQFSSLHNLAQHKKIPCQLRVSSQTQPEDGPTGDNCEPALLVCAICDGEFKSAWALCLHCKEEHKLSIYKTEDDEAEAGGDSDFNGSLSS